MQRHSGDHIKGKKTKLEDGYQKLIDSYQKLVDDYQKLEDDYQKLVDDYQKLVDGWKITLSFELSSSPYHIHLQPVTPFLEDMADFFTHSVFYICKIILIRFAQKLLPVIIPLYQISSVPFCLISCEEAPTIISNSPASSTRFIS